VGPAREVLAHPARRDADRRRDPARPEGPVRDDDELAQPEEDRAPLTLGVHAVADAAQRRADEQAAGARPHGGGRRVAHGAHHRRRRALHDLDGDVPREAVRDDDVRFARGDPEALDVPRELQGTLRRGRREQLVGREQPGRPLRRLLAVGEQRDPGPRDPEHELGVGRAHVGELHEVLRADLDVRPHVEHEERMARRGDRHRERGAVHARGALDPEQARGERGARGAAGHEGVGAAVGDGLHGRDHGGLGMGAHGARGIGGLRDRERGVDELDARVRFDSHDRPEQQDLHAVLADRERGAARHLGRAEIGPAGVDGDRDRLGHTTDGLSGRGRARGRGCARPRARRRTRSSGRPGADGGACGTAGTR
jgi:hypothetical protein